MKASALVYLRDNPAAQRLCVAWPLVTPRTGSSRSLALRWAALADVPPHVAVKLAPVLQVHEICKPDGSVDPLAEQFISSQVAGAIRAVHR